ncbi:MAG: hypothetical protein AUG51_01720 [Acidobacteria bacterium 13_1_20CM_3_53_8]|nr:MAG: hypothetical protein AUG51_01720 [Acidobacteria bacterium 13_1_20CM_3_53_8]
MASLAAAPVELRASEKFQKAIDLMAHIVAARRMWLWRFGVLEQESSPELFPRENSITELPALLVEMESGWSEFLDGLTDEAIARSFEYQSYEGPRFRNTIEDILTQLFGHSWYHRGQIAQLLRSIGAEPAVTDFVFWTREPVTG